MYWHVASVYLTRGNLVKLHSYVVVLMIVHDLHNMKNREERDQYGNLLMDHRRTLERTQYVRSMAASQ